MYSSPRLGSLRIEASAEVVQWSGAILESCVPMKGNENVLASPSGLSTGSESFSPLPANDGKGGTHRVFMMELRPMTGDAVPGPLAFFALRQQHGVRARRCHRADGIAHATGLLRRSGCLPAEPYPPQQRLQTTDNARRSQEARQWPLACCSMLLAQSEKCRGLGRSPKESQVDKLE